MAKKYNPQGQPVPKAQDQPETLTQPDLQDLPEQQDLNQPEQLALPGLAKKNNSFIPKENSKKDAVRVHETVEVSEPNAVEPQEQIVSTHQLTIDEAISQAMLTPNPMSFVRRLAAEHKLREVTATYKALEELGHK